MLLAVDITNELQLLFDNISNVYSLLDEVFVFTAFGFEFSMLGLILGLIFLIVLIKSFRFGFGSELTAPIHFSREENRGSDDEGYVPKHAHDSLDDGYVPKHIGKYSSNTYYPRHAKDD